MNRNEPREGWTLDNEGSSREAESTFAERARIARERMSEAARDAKASARDLIRRDRP